MAFLPNSNVFLIWVVFLFYSAAVITFCFLISVIFKKSTTAGNVGTIIFVVNFIFYYQYRNDFVDMNYIVKMLYCLPLNTALGQVFAIILDLDFAHGGLSFSNFATHVPGFNFSVLEMLMMFVIISVIQLLAMIYIEQVFTGSIGVAKPWFFPFLPIIKRCKGEKASNQQGSAMPQKSMARSDYEDDPTGMKAGIVISDLSKTFGKLTVVNQLNLKMYENQITVLLGHNGAGKTTTMNMLTGMFSPTSGTAFLNGFDITTQTVDARNSLGLCPQHNVLFDDLTVEEHIIFFCRLKGVSNQTEINDEIMKYAELLDFQDKVEALSKTLSGGQKRKLSIGVALCGKSKIVMLDEPTSGLDAGARRALWNLLIQEKKGRTILLTTHHMDEADVLGDRIAIMNEGELQTVGSSFFLKRRFGSGYKFICVKDQHFNPNEVLQVLKEFAPDATLESNAQTEAVFIISETHVSRFHEMFKKIEDQSDRLRISSFGCSLTTLEEVFIKVGSQVDASHNQNHQNLQFNDFVPSKKVTGFSLIWYQVYAMLLKKFHFHRRNLYSIIWLTLMTAGITYALLVAPINFDLYNYDDFRDIPEISLSKFKSSVTAVEHDGSNPGFVDAYTSLFSGKDRVQQIGTQNFTEFVFQKYQSSEQNVRMTYMLGLTLSENKLYAWYNDYISYSLVRSVALNLIHRAMLKSIAGPDYDILAFNRNFNQTGYIRPTSMPDEDDWSIAATGFKRLRRAISTADEDEDTVLTPEQELTLDSMLANFALIFLLFYVILIYWPSVIITMKVKERVNRSKLLQYISGANRFIYWLTTFVVDYVFLMIVFFTILGVVAANQRAYFRTGEQIGVLMTIFSFYGLTTVGFVYFLSFIFEKHSTAETSIAVLGLLCKMMNFINSKLTGTFFIPVGILFVVYTLLKFFLKWYIVADTFYWIFLLFGPFNMIDCFRKIAFRSVEVIDCEFVVL